MDIEITLGALAPSIIEQLKEFNLPEELNLPDGKIAQLQSFDLDASAITRLHVRGIITDAECNNARKRLMKKIAKALNETS